jgi:hypothetical protein
MRVQWNFRVAFFTTRILAEIIGVATVLGFFAGTKGFFFYVAMFLSIAGWTAVYLFFAEMARRGARYERVQS